MKSRIVASGDSAELKTLMSRLETGIPQDAKLLYNKRNKVALITSEGGNLVYKQFSSVLKNRLIYAIFSSKAKRSYEHSLKLELLGIHTPRPLAYSEKRNSLHMLIHSAYLSEYQESIPLVEYLKEAPQERWEAFAGFAAELHDKGILHKDMNDTNVRVRTKDGKTEFSLIDNNRMKFFDPGKMPVKTALSGLVRFSYLSDEYKAFLKFYIKKRNLDEKYYPVAVEMKRRFDEYTDRKNARKRRKGRL